MTLLTTGQIAEQFGVQRQQVSYALERRNIQPRFRAGIMRLFDEGQIPVIEAALKSIRPKRSGKDCDAVAAERE